MPDLNLFQRALGLVEPWEVVEEKFDAEQKRLDLRIDFAKGSKFACPECGREGCPVHDTESHTWRHLNFFEHEAYLTARVPRVICPEHGTKQVKVPWARERSDFTLLFEALARLSGFSGNFEWRSSRPVRSGWERSGRQPSPKGQEEPP